MDITKIYPKSLDGEVIIPSSKSMGHREIICASLADGVSIVDNISMSKDIEATCKGLVSMGANIKVIPSKIIGRTALEIIGNSGNIKVIDNIIDCNESGSTLRFFIPLGCLTNDEVIFKGSGFLPSRPLDSYFEIFNEQNLDYKILSNEGGKNLPLSINGRLKPGKYSLLGNVSSQFISGLLFALPLLEGDSEINITSNLESQSYIEMTLASLKKYGIEIIHENYMKYIIKGNQKYKPCNSQVEGDYSQVAFWLVAGQINNNKIISKGMSETSLQGDKAVIDIIRNMGGKLDINEGKIISYPSKTFGTIIDATNCPDIIPVLTILASVSSGETKIINAGRLRIKECDRLRAITTELNKLGGDIQELEDGLIIHGVESLSGGEVDSWNDHRIAMSMAVASLKCKEPLIIKGSEAITKSYPLFWEDFKNLGGNLEKVMKHE